MRRGLLSLALGLGVATAAELVYITDLAIYSALAPCAQSAISYNVQYLTNSICPEPISDLQACVCTKNNNLASISKGVSSSVSYSCGGGAAADQASASTVLSGYCNQDALPTFPPPEFPVSYYITEIPEIEALAPCAKSALSYGIRSLTYSDCPSDATALASCACLKNQNSALVNKIISSSAKSSCSNIAPDVTSAVNFFAAYCAMANGTTNFPQPTNPPGDMTYYVTDLPSFDSLAKCAASALSYAVQSNTYDLCPPGPQALASCACIKEGMPRIISNIITSSVKYSCSSTATDDVSSAMAVYNFYCSAARAETTATGVTVSVEQTYPAGLEPATGSRSGTGASQSTGAGGKSGSTEGGSTDSSGPSTAIIGGAVAGVVVVLGIIGALVFFLMKSVRKRKELEKQQSDQIPMTRPTTTGGDHDPHPHEYYGKTELSGDTAITGAAAPLPPPSPALSMMKPGQLPPRAGTVSPASVHASAFTPPPNHAELHGQAPPMPPLPNSAELHAQAPPYPAGAELPGQGPAHSPSPNTAELYGQAAAFQRPELQGRQQQPNTPELQGQGGGGMYRPELQGQGPMYPPPNNTQELAGQGSSQMSPYPGPHRQELAGQYNYPPQQQQSPPPGYPQSPPPGYPQQVSPQGYQQPSPQGYPSPQQQGYAAGWGQQTPGPVSPASTYVMSPAQQQQQQQGGMGWQSGPTVHEMDGGFYRGGENEGGAGQAR